MQLGLIGKSLVHSFSGDYFTTKFKAWGLEGYSYDNFPLNDIKEFPALLEQRPDLHGLNVTIPYKQAVIPYLDEIDPVAREIGAVNTIYIRQGKLYGYNTDIYGFTESLKPLLTRSIEKALILGTGGASLAVALGLKQLGIQAIRVSRNAKTQQLDYVQASALLGEYQLVVNTTPLGTFPNLNEIPDLRLEGLSENHLIYDLIYNPPKSRLLTEAEAHGARIKNGREMLELQADRAWAIWNEV